MKRDDFDPTKWHALALIQPWAWLVLHHKPIENRVWHLWPSMRGRRFLIHASKKMTDDDYMGASIFAKNRCGVELPTSFEELKFGGIVGVARVVDCLCPDSMHHLQHPGLDLRWWMREQHGFVLEDRKPLPFVPLRGMHGFFRVPDDVLRQLPEDLGNP